MTDSRRRSSSESEGDTGDASIKILINDVTPCDSREFLHLSTALLQVPIRRRTAPRKQSIKAPLQRRASWCCSRKQAAQRKINRCWSVGVLVPCQSANSANQDFLFQGSRFSSTKEGSTESIPGEGMKEKQRSFSAGSREDVFMFCNQLQDSVQSMTDVASDRAHSLSINIPEPKVAKKHSLAGLNRKNSRKEEWLIAPRSTLQKSVSTPSIVAAQEIQEIAHRKDGRDRNLLKTGAQDNEEDKPFGKRKKRGSLFFRKKKNKEKENKKNSSHQFVSICYSTAATCDVCNRGLANKSALKCESCSVTVHDSSCKDHVPNCVQNKVITSTEKEVNSSLLTPSGSVRYPSRYRHLVGAPLTHSQSLIHLGKNSLPAKEKKSSLTDTTRINIISTTDSSKVSSPSSNKVICEEKVEEVVEDLSSNILETNSASIESLDDGSQGTSDAEDDTMQQLLDDEPESWNGTVDKKILKKLKDKDVKRQEAIYELILTEKHHCLTLKIMQRVFAKGMVQELNVTRDMVQRLFPCLEQLLRYHLNFLQRLRERQRTETVVSSIGDILVQQFEGQNADDLCSFYSQFCSQHKDALSLYKDILKSDRKFQSFVKRCSLKPFCKARGIPECILLVTQRVTKYPLLIDALIKTTRDNKQETENLNKALGNIKEIVAQVNAAVAAKEKETRLLEIYNRIDAKSTAFYRRKKFKKSDLLSDSRKLRFEGTLEWKSARGKVIDIHMIILSDVIVLLQENNQKFTFASLDNKAAVISLPKLLVREKAGQQSRGIYLISSNPKDPEMYEMLCASPKDKKHWMQVIRDAAAMAARESREKHLLRGRTDSDIQVDDEKTAKIADLCASMQEKDVEIVTLCEEKMKAMFGALEVLGIDKQKFTHVDFHQFLNKEEEETEQLLLANLSQACHIASRMLYYDTYPSTNSAECTTSATMSPVLPKRAETFGGFDNSGREVTDKVTVLKKKLMQLKEMDGDYCGERELSYSDSSLHMKTRAESAPNQKFVPIVKTPDSSSSGSNLNYSSSSGGFNRLEELAELNQLLSSVMSLLHHHLSVYRKEFGRRHRYRPDQQLEELRNIQEKLSQERLQWEQEKARQEKDLDRRREELLNIQRLISGEQANKEKNKLTSHIPDRTCNSPGICKHKRSASYDFRTLGNLNQDTGGRQSWSGPIDDISLAWHQQFCSTQSSSNILQAVNSNHHPSSQESSPVSVSSPGFHERISDELRPWPKDCVVNSKCLSPPACEVNGK